MMTVGNMPLPHATNHWPLGLWADVAQLVERVLGKDEVSGSIPLIGSRDLQLRELSWDCRQAALRGVT